MPVHAARKRSGKELSIKATFNSEDVDATRLLLGDLLTRKLAPLVATIADRLAASIDERVDGQVLKRMYEEWEYTEELNPRW